MTSIHIPAMFALVILFSLTSPAYAGESISKKNEITDIGELLTDSAAGHVSAASLLGISPDSVTAVENIRGFVAAVKGLGTPGNSVGFSVAPARTSILPMSLPTYGKGFFYRFLGNTSFSYAQGAAKVSGIDIERRAIAVETNATFDDKDDLVLAVVDVCKWEPPIVPPGTTPDFSEANRKYRDCVDKTEKTINEKWNISRISVSFGTGQIKADGGTSTGLGNTVALGLVYGFDHAGMDILKDGAAVALTIRRTTDDPILESLATATVNKRSSTVAALRISGGSPMFRGLAEISNADSSDISISQRIFRYAAGFDYRIAEGMWVGFRIGKQRKISATGDEVASLLDFSFSPKGLQ